MNAQQLTAATQIDNPTFHSIDKKDKRGWQALTSWDLPENHRLKITTWKMEGRGLLTVASVCTFETERGYSCETHTIGVGGDGDLYIQLARSDVRVTEKAVAGQHRSAIDTFFDEVMKRVVAKYGSAMKLEGVERTLREIAIEIKQLWPKVYFGAVPYLDAMMQIRGGADATYGCEDGKTQIIYFLSNAATWKGEDAKRIKAELKKMAGIK
jgi:hypothetical protein